MNIRSHVFITICFPFFFYLYTLQVWKFKPQTMLWVSQYLDLFSLASSPFKTNKQTDRWSNKELQKHTIGPSCLEILYSCSCSVRLSEEIILLMLSWVSKISWLLLYMLFSCRQKDNKTYYTAWAVSWWEWVGVRGSASFAVMSCC